MLFSTPTFLFLFLPVVCLLSWLAPRSWRNSVLLAASLFFYAWGETVFVLLMLASIGLNHVLVRALEAGRPAHRRRIVTLAVAANLGLLVLFKYAGFLFAEGANLLALLGLSEAARVIAALPSPEHLPIGISFFTFQALSYVLDVYRGDAPAQAGPLRLALYISLFPQLIAGPIVRYRQIAEQLAERTVALADVAAGVRRFILGLSKKVLVANTLAVAADAIFALPSGELSASVVWFGALCYALQIYFDFSGYSDMAIGLGRMFGFRFPENFNFPYAARSITDFWRRWHISLSSWFRDYLYIPLGGNRRGPWRTYRNLLVVFALCGLWHGANLTFLVWGLYHGAFLILERRLSASAWLAGWSPPPILRFTYCAAVVLVGWVIFRAENLAHALVLLQLMTGIAGGAPDALIAHHATPEILLALVCAVLVSAPPLVSRLFAFGEKILAMGGERAVLRSAVASAGALGLAALLLACATRLAVDSYNPFIYFRF